MNGLIAHDSYEPYTVIYQGFTLEPTFMIGKGHIYTLATSPKDPNDPDEACVDMHLRDWYRCDDKEISDHFIIDSYYDSMVRCHRSRVDHQTMFNVLKMFAFFCGMNKIEVLDGSRKITPTGCPWNLRVMNRLMKGPGSKTFYERFGFRPCNDYLFFSRIRLASLKPYLNEDTIYFFSHHNWRTIEDIVHGMYTLCNREYIQEYDTIQNDFIRSIDLYYRNSLKATDIHKAAMAYLFCINPALDRLRPTLHIEPKTDHTQGVIRIQLDGSEEQIHDILNTSYVRGGRKTKRNQRRLV